jgi:hypothetical protein
MEKSPEINLSDTNFIGWLISRLEYLHGYAKDDPIICRLNKIKHSFKYSNNDLDKVISKYFIDFFLNKDTSTNIGYTDKERDDLRHAIKQIIEDIRSNNIPKEILLK